MTLPQYGQEIARLDPAGSVVVPPDYPDRIELPSGILSWTIPGWFASSGQDTVQDVDTLYFTPIFVARATTFDRVGVDVNGAAVGGSVLRFGLYAITPSTLLPGALLNDFGTVLVDGVGDKEIIIDLTLERGYYLAAHISDGAPNLECIAGTAATTMPVQGWNRSGVDAPSRLIRVATAQAGIAVGGLADPAPATDDDEGEENAAFHFRNTP